MILIHIVTKEEDQAIEIVDFLMEEKLILDAVMMEKVMRREKNKNGIIESVSETLILGKTKALLFNDIDHILREKYKETMPVLYSIPIVNMDWEQVNELINETVKK